MPTVTVQPEGVVVELRAGETVLEGLYRAGYAYRTGCRRGGCGICKADLVVGDVEYHKAVADTVLPAAERGSGTCLTCRAVPAGDVCITLRNDRLRALHPLLAFRPSSTPVGGTGPDLAGQTGTHLAGGTGSEN
ncbi:2Fe-2S iron-sulfur cluster-binding protein [Streptomyces sp. GC420]|uniref:2Fe-2S iron-sulfur cluster-binding protein n=1 Tax=Streptomyces sp. GC420 TaxID=2697568 RepID=UPI0014152395|nr:2Fe-2S iron-sulfur cluster-binding protein [Streptomyces sp. GC420]NBM16138.1 2Fe-2S iron-sulfur cluster binding domain-containing protein [Streptomyces sp. GC420]